MCPGSKLDRQSEQQKIIKDDTVAVLYFIFYILVLGLFLFTEQFGDFVTLRQESVVSLYPQCQVCLLGALRAVAWSTWAVIAACRQNRANLNIDN